MDEHFAIADLIATPVEDFIREQWTTCYIARLDVGTIFSRRETPLRPLVLIASRTEEVPGDTHGWAIGEARDIATSEPVEFKLRANTSIFARCDLVFVPKGNAS